MSNAVVSLAAVIVPSDLKKNSENSSCNLSDTNSTNSSDSIANDSPKSLNTISSSSSSFSVKTDSSSSLNQMANSTNLASTSSTSIPQTSVQQQQQQHHQVIQYFQYPSTNSTTPVNVSPLSSLTSSPSTTNTPTTTTSSTSLHYHHAHHPPHFYNHHHHSHHHPTLAFNPNTAHFVQAQQAGAAPQQFHTFNPNFKDTRWLTLEVCREHQRNKCNRTETECKFAHPPQHVEIVNGKVIACYDSLKGKCTRKEPPCKYLHPPQHLKDQLLQNGKNNLVLRQVALAMMQQQHQQQPGNGNTNAAALLAVNAIPAQANTPLAQYATFTTNSTGATPNGAPVTNTPTAQIIPASALANAGLTAYSQVQLNANGQPTLLPMIAAHNGFHPAHANQHLQAQQAAFLAADPTTTALLHQVQAASGLSPGAAAATANGLLAPQQRTDRLLICKDFQNSNCQKSANECAYAHPPAHCPVDTENSLVTVCVDFIKGKCSRETCKYFHPPEHLVAQLKKQKISNNAAVAALNAALTVNTLGLLPASLPTTNFAPYIGLNQNPVQIHTLPPYHAAPHTHFRSYHQTNNHFNRQYANNNNNNQLNSILNASNASNLHVIHTHTNGHVNLKAQSHGSCPSTPRSQSNNSPFVSNNSNNTLITAALASANGTTSAATLQGNDLSDAHNTATFTLENGQTYQIPQFQIYTPIYQRAPNATLTNKTNGSTEELNQQNDLNKAASASATAAVNAAVTTANVVDVVPGKKRPHDAIEHDFIPLNTNAVTNGQASQAASIPIKRTALTDAKTGMPVFHSYNAHHAQQAAFHAMHPQAQHLTLAQHPVSAVAALNYPTAFNIPMQYGQYISLPYASHSSGVPRL